MKKCPFCAEEIQDDAVKCRYCHEPLETTTLAWYFRPAWLVLAFLTIGPLALPLVWFHPRMTPAVKAMISIAVIALSWVLGIAVSRALKSLGDYYQMLLS